MPFHIPSCLIVLLKAWTCRNADILSSRRSQYAPALEQGVCFSFFLRPIRGGRLGCGTRWHVHVKQIGIQPCCKVAQQSLLQCKYSGPRLGSDFALECSSMPLKSQSEVYNRQNRLVVVFYGGLRALGHLAPQIPEETLGDSVAPRWCRSLRAPQSYFRLLLAHHSRSASPTKSRGSSQRRTPSRSLKGLPAS